jgi:hypothetical protein
MRWEPGDVIVERGVFFGSVFIARPMRVVAHAGDVLATSLTVGTEYYGLSATSREAVIDEFARGEVTWGMKTWDTHNVLILAREGDPYSVQAFWNEEGRFVGWYINLQDELRWTDIGYDTRDHALDLILGEDLASFIWKDEDELASLIELGVFTADEGTQFRRDGEAVLELMHRGASWWAPWRDRAPDDWGLAPELPHGWDVT